MTYVHFLQEFGRILAALLIVLDPVAILPVMIGLTAQASPRDFKRMVLRIVAGSTILLLFFIVTGTWVLGLFKVTISDLRIGGGLLLLIIAIRLVLEGKLSNSRDIDQEYRAAIIPIISPLLIGPGAITASVVLAAIHGVFLTSLAALVAMLICLLFFLATRLIYQLIGDSGADLFSRIMGVLIAAIAVSYMREGVLDLVKSFSLR